MGVQPPEFVFPNVSPHAHHGGLELSLAVHVGAEGGSRGGDDGWLPSSVQG